MSRLQNSYKNFVIQATAVPLREPKNHFTVHVNIRRDTGAFSEDTIFQSGQVFANENEALEAGIQIGKQKIDNGFQLRNVVVNVNDPVALKD